MTAASRQEAAKGIFGAGEMCRRTTRNPQTCREIDQGEGPGLVSSRHRPEICLSGEFQLPTIARTYLTCHAAPGHILWAAKDRQHHWSQHVEPGDF